MTPYSLLLRSVSVGQAARPRGGEEGQAKEVMGATSLISILELFPAQMGAVQLRGDEEERVREAPILDRQGLSNSLAVCQLETFGTKQLQTTSATVCKVQPRRLRPLGRCDQTQLHNSLGVEQHLLLLQPD